MNEPFIPCSFPCCKKQIASSRISKVCYAEHIFLGGTCGNNTWRDGFMSRVREASDKEICFFDPVVADWNDEAKTKEDLAKQLANLLIFYLGDPQEKGNHTSYYSIFEAAQSLMHDRPESTIAAFETTDLPQHAINANIKAYYDLLHRFPGRHVFASLLEAEWLLKEKLAG
jgi:hypothetical protein